MHDFQAKRVKQRVYAPDWTERERADWTVRISKAFADLLPEGRPGSVSTLAGTYRPWRHDRATLQKIAANYLRALAALAGRAQGCRLACQIVLAQEALVVAW